MSTSSALTKNCPHCRSVLAQEIEVCGCGHKFSDKMSADMPSSHLVAQAEALYESHLRARLQRATRTARFAKMDLLRDPRDPVKTNQLREAEKEMRLLETQLMIQSARVAEARANANNPPPTPAFTPAAVMTTEAPEIFRAAQAIKAEETIEALQMQAATEQLRAAEATGVFKAVQAEKARTIAENADHARACPGCGTAVKAGTVRCACGYVLLGSSATPDFISAEELAALRSNA